MHLAQRGRVQTGWVESGRVRGRVESSRIWLTVMTSSSATDALKWARNSAADRHPSPCHLDSLARLAAPQHASTKEALVTTTPSASPGRIVGLRNQAPRHKMPRHAAHHWLLFLFSTWAGDVSARATRQCFTSVLRATHSTLSVYSGLNHVP